MPDTPNEPRERRPATRSAFSGVTPLRAPRSDEAPPRAGETPSRDAGAAARDPSAPPREKPSGSRKLIRPSLSQHVGRAPGSAGAGRGRALPPEQTGAENAQLARWSTTGAAVAVTFEDGRVERGTIEWHDRESFALTRATAPALVVMKHAVASVAEDGHAPARATATPPRRG